MTRTPSQLAEFVSRLARIDRYLHSSKLHFNHEDVLELNPAPFKHAEEALPMGDPLAYITLFMRETVWSPEDLEGRKIMCQALKAWCLAQLYPDKDLTNAL